MRNLLKDYGLILVMCAAVIVSGVTLMMVSQKVYETQRTITVMDREALMTEWEIRSLNAELAFLTSPERLEQITTAMVNSLTPASGGNILVVSPASFSAYEPRTLSILPNRKPAITAKPIQVSAPSYTPPTKQANQSDDFSSLLNTIGGVN